MDYVESIKQKMQTNPPTYERPQLIWQLRMFEWLIWKSVIKPGVVYSSEPLLINSLIKYILT